MVARLIAVLLCAALAPAWAQHYRWTDEKGRLHFSDSPPPASAKSVQKKASVVAPSNPANEPFALQEARRNFPVTLYSAPACPVCDEARKLLNTRGVPFREVSVTTPAQYEALKGVVGTGAVPVLLVGSASHKGFEEQTYQQALDAAGYPKTGVLQPRKQGAPASAEQAAAAPSEPAARGPYAPRTGPASPTSEERLERRVLR